MLGAARVATLCLLELHVAASLKIFDLLRPSETRTEALFKADDPSGWNTPESLPFDGFLVKRPFLSKWDALQPDIDDAHARFGKALGVDASCESPEHFAFAVDELLSAAALPAELSIQIREDACALGRAWTAICPEIPQASVKLEIFGENTCSRWHCDRFVGRGIVSYTGEVGTAFTKKSNVDLWELKNCGNNDCVIRDPAQIEHVAVGDLLLIKGTKYPQCSNALVHKSPEKRYDAQGNVVNRLVLKVDVDALPQLR